MEAEWYFEQDGESVGPVSIEEIQRRVKRAKGQPHYVWTTGLSEWTDARTLPQFSSRLQRKTAARALRDIARALRTAAGEHANLVRRARHELISYFAVSAYLLVWFSAVMFYKATILHGVGVEFAPFGLAVVKALILGKFILVLEALKIGEGGKDGAILAVQILKKAVLFTLLLIVLSVIEEVVVGYLHGREAREALSQMGGGTLSQAIATGVLMFLVLLPYLAFRQIALTLGELPELLFTRRTLAKRD
jgi:hypothetical protein